MTAWHSRPLERVYAAVFIDALHQDPRRQSRPPAGLRRNRGNLAGH